MSSILHEWTPNSTHLEGQATRHRIRSIRGIQVRNLTRYPHRDRAASALQQSIDLPISNADGHLADDIDIALARRRTRKVSSSSVATVRSTRGTAADPAAPASAAGHANGTADHPKGRGRPNAPNTSPSRPPITVPPALRRQRSSSRASILSVRPSSSLAHASTTSSPLEAQFSYLTPAPDQHHLEQVISSRLIETFITLTLPDDPQPPVVIPASRSNPEKLVSHPRAPSTPRSSVSSPSRAAPSSNLRRNMKLPSSEISRSTRTPSPSPSLNRSMTTPHSSVQQAHIPSPPPAPSVPFYISPFHRPSTNPSFKNLDPDREFAEWANTAKDEVIIVVWGRTKGRDTDVDGKGKQKEDHEVVSEWEVLVEWKVEMGSLVPLPPDLAQQPDRLPPNCLLLSLVPFENLYCLPSVLRSPSSETPDGYQSDGELESVRKRAELKVDKRTVYEVSLRETKMKKSAAFPDLVRLATLQAVVADTRTSVNAIAASAAKILGDPSSVTSLRRQASEREEWLHTVRAQSEAMKERTRQVSDDIRRRSRELQARREELTHARELFQEDIVARRDLESQLLEAKSTRCSIAQSLPSVRASLARTLDFIFPIEPLSSGDLLFKILDCPLPIPIGFTDPTPPLALTDYPSVNEDSVASALGYAAEVVQLLGEYLDVYLPYSIMYRGSRSLIKDPISEMRGPRMFPLYSRGVETYRFEYGVFLLNKDIELLMMRRNLRALDLRHTLPNLKNLMLTLTSGTSEDQPRRHPLSIAEESTDQDLEADTMTEDDSASVTASTSTVTLPSSRRQLLSPLAAMLRSRYAGGGFLKPAVVPMDPPMPPMEVALAEDVVHVPPDGPVTPGLPSPRSLAPSPSNGLDEVDGDGGGAGVVGEKEIGNGHSGEGGQREVEARGGR